MNHTSNMQRTVIRAAIIGCAALFAMACSSKGNLVNPGDGKEHSDGAAGASSVTTDGGGAGTTGVQGMPEGGLILGKGLQGDSGRDASCGNSTLSATPPEVNILLVIDESGSMTTKLEGTSGDKWAAMKSALGTALAGTASRISFGLELFPAPADPKKPIALDCTDNCCEMPTVGDVTVSVETGATAVPKIMSALDASAPGGGTPTAEALRRAVDYFTKGAGAKLGGDRYVLLATDGGPDCNTGLTCAASACTTNLDGECPLPSGGNCCDAMFGGAAAHSRCLDDGGTTAQIKALHDAGVRTFVVGIPGSEAYGTALDAFAEAGGEAQTTGAHKYFAVAAAGGTSALTTALSTITKGVINTCRLVLGSMPPDLGKLNVSIDGVIVPQAGANGWKVDTSSTPPAIVLEGSTCANVEKNGAEKVVVQYGCPTLITR